jgi:hypothetical protein
MMLQNDIKLICGIIKNNLTPKARELGLKVLVDFQDSFHIRWIHVFIDSENNTITILPSFYAFPIFLPSMAQQLLFSLHCPYDKPESQSPQQYIENCFDHRFVLGIEP